MNVKAVVSWALVVTAFGACAARGQDLGGPSYVTPLPPAAAEAPADAAAQAKPPVVHSLSDWITYTRPDCCGPVGGSGPIGYELYARSGWSIPIGGPIFRERIETGWTIVGGARLLLFNLPQTAAWTFDLGLRNTYNHGQRDDLPITLFLRDVTTNPTTGQLVNPGTFVRKDVTIRSINRTYVTAWLGREWFLTGAPDGCHWNWRTGFDVGGWYGTIKANLDEFMMRSYFRRNDVIGSVALAWHTDVEVPCGCCTFLGGVRAEASYTWCDVFQGQNHSDLPEVSLLFNLGVRY
jgi:hypothetical protein